MADVKWIKLAVGLPDNRKIKQIRKLPDGDTIALMWIFLMCLAGETNEDGFIYFTPEIPYTEEMLADQFSMDINTVRLGLSTFRKFGMLEIIDDIIKLDSWEKWQATDKLAEMREKSRQRVAKHRENKKLLDCNVTVTDCNVTSNVTVTDCNAVDKIREDKNKERDKEEKENIKRKVCGTTEEGSDVRQYGEYFNVYFTDEEYEKLQDEFPDDYEKRIETLSSYIASTGKKYKNHLATIKNWASKEQKETGQQSNPPQQNNGYTNPFLALAKQEGML